MADPGEIDRTLHAPGKPGEDSGRHLPANEVSADERTGDALGGGSDEGFGPSDPSEVTHTSVSDHGAVRRVDDDAEETGVRTDANTDPSPFDDSGRTAGRAVPDSDVRTVRAGDGGVGWAAVEQPAAGDFRQAERRSMRPGERPDDQELTTPLVGGARAEPAVDRARLKSGAVLRDRWTLDRPLGAGGMGQVWLARDSAVGNKSVAIKFIGSVIASDPVVVERLVAEASIHQDLNHEAIVPIRSFEPTGADGFCFLVMNYIEGRTLADMQVQEPGGIPIDRLRGWLWRVAEAIDYAHKRGVLHRDVKPSNILVESETSDAYLLDFGIGKAMAREVGVVEEWDIAGTPPYMSPQQVVGEDRRENDIFSLAATAYHLLTGVRPFDRVPPKLRGSSLLEFQSGMSHRARQAFIAALSFEPRERPWRAVEFVQSLVIGQAAGRRSAVGTSGESGVAREIAEQILDTREPITGTRTGRAAATGSDSEPESRTHVGEPFSVYSVFSAFAITLVRYVLMLAASCAGVAVYAAATCAFIVASGVLWRGVFGAADMSDLAVMAVVGIVAVVGQPALGWWFIQRPRSMFRQVIVVMWLLVVITAGVVSAQALAG